MSNILFSSNSMIRSYRIALTFPTSPAQVQPHALPCQPFASHSAILSIAGFLVRQLNELQPPGRCSQMENEHSKLPIEEVHIDNLELLPNFGLWCAYICNCVFSQHAVVVDGTLHVEIPLPEPSHPLTNAHKSLFLPKATPLSPTPTDQRLSYLFDLPSIPRQNLKMGIFCYTSPQNADYKYLNSSYLLGQLYDNQRWEFIDVSHRTEGSVPTVEELMGFDLVLLPGSENSVYDRHGRLEEAAGRLFEAYRRSKGLKILAVCFGHQLVAVNFGVEVQKKNACRNIERVEISQKLVKEFGFLRPMGEAGVTELHISQNHSDHVMGMPEGFHLLGASGSCEIEGLVSEDGRIFTMQFHPEFFCNNFLRGEEERGEGGGMRERHYRDSMIVRECMYLFMRE